MLFALILVIATFAAWVLGGRSTGWQDHARRGMAAAMVVAGVAHLVGPQPFVQHLPEWIPAREALVYLSGVVEIGLGIALVSASAARRASVGRFVALFLVAVWPANVYVAVAGIDVDGQPGGLYSWIRLPFQLLFVAWALWSTRGTRSTTEATGPALSSIPTSRLAADPKGI